MTLNCRVGDLAIVVRAPLCAVRAIGSIVRCESLFDFDGKQVWIVEPPAAGHYWGIADRWLKPLRDPGDDAIDWISKRTPRSVDLRQDVITRARKEMA